MKPSVSVDRLARIQLQLRDYEEAMRRIYEDAWITPTRPLVLTRLLGATGRRLGEVLQLATADILWEEKRILWRIEKKREQEILSLPISERDLRLLDRYIRLNGISYRLFEISRVQAWRDVKKTLERYGLRGWRPHDLRHAFALKMLLETKDIEKTRRWLAHSDYRLILYYVRVVGLDFDRYPVEL